MAEDLTKGGQLRLALSKHRERRRHGKYPDDLQRRAVEYCAERRRAGASVVEIARELGVQDATAGAWASKPAKLTPFQSAAPISHASALSLVPVVVRPEAQSAPRHTRLEVEFSDGTRLSASGLVGRDLVEAIESLRRIR